MTHSNILIGTALTFGAAVAFAGNSTAAKLAYEGGANPLTFLTMRSVLAALLVLAIIILTGRSVYMPMRRRIAALGIGVLATVYSYGLLSAIQYIPVALAVLIFYTFPLMTSLYTWISGREKPSIAALVALITAFAGLILALDVRGGHLNVEGVTLAFIAAIGLTAVVLLNNRMVGASDPHPVTFHMMVSMTVVSIIVAMLSGGYAIPDSGTGWFHLTLGTSLYAAAIVTIFIAFSLAGTVATSLTMNVEPVSSVVLGFLILGQALNAWQVVGVALVIAAVLSVRLADIRRSNAARDASA